MERSIERGLSLFKEQMLIAHPFYGDILLRLPIIRDDDVRTACVDGKTIRWSKAFFEKLTEAQRNYVLMHEVFHALLLHPLRMKERDPRIWNIAADLIVNRMCDLLAQDVRKNGILMERPEKGAFGRISDAETVENLYGTILKDNTGQKDRPYIFIRNIYSSTWGQKTETRPLSDVLPMEDLRPVSGAGPGDGAGPGKAHAENGKDALSPGEQALQDEIRLLIRNAAGKERGLAASGLVTGELLRLIQPKPLDWRKILREFLNEIQSDETSYATPERKYLHMDMILPGHGMKEEGELESVWAFIDSSGSVSRADLEEFLSQMHSIVKEFQCEMNIAYWDTSVTDVYEKIRREQQVLEAQPHHSGGTDINCVYRYVGERRLKPLVSLILTDGYFGTPDPELKKALPEKSTILLLCNDSENPIYRTVGRVCRLKDGKGKTR